MTSVDHGRGRYAREDPLRWWCRVLELAGASSNDDLLGVMCALAQEDLGVDGAAIVLRTHGGAQDLLASSGSRTVALDEMHYTAGQGPALSAFREDRPVLVPEVGAVDERWPGFTALAVETDIGAVFCFPLTAGTEPMATLDLHRTRPGPLLVPQLADAHVIAELTIGVLMWDHQQLLERTLGDTGHYGPVETAVGMLSGQLDLPVDDARARLRAHAFAEGRSPRQVAADVLAGRLRLDLPHL